MDKTAIIVIPIYRPVPEASERASLKQCLAILGQHPICFVCAEGFDASHYLQIIPTATLERFNPFYFESVLTYNKLLLSLHFYKRFSAYKYMLVYQTDAWVFRDELKYWCGQGYDYIGSPVHRFTVDKFSSLVELATVNGGFSLRKTQSHIRTLSSFRFIYPFGRLLSANVNEHGIKGLFKALNYHFLGNNTHHCLNRYDRNEDYFWAIQVPRKLPWFRVAPVAVALHFGFDNFPEISFQKSGNVLPFGCHAFMKNVSFWNKYIATE